jgi:hypothetical protein
MPRISLYLVQPPTSVSQTGGTSGNALKKNSHCSAALSNGYRPVSRWISGMALASIVLMDRTTQAKATSDQNNPLQRPTTSLPMTPYTYISPYCEAVSPLLPEVRELQIDNLQSETFQDDEKTEIGTRRNGQLHDTHGTRIGRNGVTSRGEFEDGVFRSGRRVFPSGGYDEGVFVNWRLEGMGTRVYPNGDRYVGQFKLGEYDGEGVRTEPNGDRLAGRFSEGLAHGVLMRTHADGRVAEETYQRGVMTFYQPIIEAATFNPHDMPVLMVPSALVHLPVKTVMRSNGDRLEGRFFEYKIAYGTLTKVQGEVYTGSFDQNGLYSGLGHRRFPDGTTEKGLFIAGAFLSGEVAVHVDGILQIQIGPRLNTQLHGDNCTRRYGEVTERGPFKGGVLDGYGTKLEAYSFFVGGSREEIGLFKGGVFQSGLHKFGNGFAVSFPFKTDHYAYRDTTGMMHYEVNGKEVLVGRAPADAQCADILVQEEAPLLLNVQTAKVFDQFVQNLPEIAAMLWGKFERILPRRADLGRKVAVALVGEKAVAGAWTSTSKHMLEIAKQWDTLSVEDQTNLGFFIAQKQFKAEPDYDWSGYCQDTFRQVITDDPSALQGLRIQCRHDYKIKQLDNFFSIPIFFTFMGVAKSYLSQSNYLPHILTTVSFRYTIDSKDRLDYENALFFTDVARFKAAFDAFFPGHEDMSVDQAMAMTDHGRSRAIDSFNAFTYGISKTARDHFSGDGHIFYLNKNAFYRLDKHQPLTKDEGVSLQKWAYCAQKSYENPKQEAITIWSRVWKFFG